jgi:PPOX class probable F420-dependent enzyme
MAALGRGSSGVPTIAVYAQRRMTEPILSVAELQLLSAARRAVLATIDEGGMPRLVPCCFAVLAHADATSPLVLHTPIDNKPKRSEDPHVLARVRDILLRPEVALLVDRWSEDWSRLGWLRLRGRAELLEPDDPAVAEERVRAIDALRAKYAQYADHALEERPVIRISVESASRWGDLRA